MSKLAVLEIGGSQYLVREGDKIKTDKVRNKKGNIKISDVLLYSTDKRTVIDQDKLKKAKADAEVLEIGRDKKIKVVKFKAKKRQLKQAGHRQAYNIIKINKITIS
jgi:large subunit ribosomal protein L21